MVKRIAILTNIDNQNYGNRLQNYASQQVFCSLRVKPETLNLWDQNIIKKIFRFTRDEYQKLCGSKRGAFLRFKNYFFWSKYSICSVSDRNKIIEYYDYVSVGSDQIWNVLWGNTNTYFLPFVPPEKRVSYAASFGITSIPEDKRAMVRENLLKFKAISVREAAGAKIVKELTGRDATVLVDPTLMLDKEEWIKIEKKPRRVDFSKPYILTYFLGQKTERMERDVKKKAGKNGLQVFNLMDKQEKALYATGPGEFIYLVHHATLVMTDSFHACVFSFLFGKPFLLYERVGSCDMMSRMDTLFDTFDLRRKYVDSGLPNAVLECDYSVGYKNLERERKKAIEFLKNALEL